MLISPELIIISVLNNKSKELYSLKEATKINSGDNLNDYTDFGNYYSSSNDISNTLLNCPQINSGFVLRVERTTGDTTNYFRQTIVPNVNSEYLFYRNKRTDGFSEWKTIFSSNKIQTGSTGAIPSPDGEITIHHIDFEKPFNNIPIVVACIYSSSDYVGYGNITMTVHNITTTGFDLRIYNNYTHSLQPAARWIAITSNN